MLRDRDYMEGSKFLLLLGFYFYSLFFLIFLDFRFFRFDNSRQEDAHQSAPFTAIVRIDEELNKVGSFRGFLNFKLNFLILATL